MTGARWEAWDKWTHFLVRSNDSALFHVPPSNRARARTGPRVGNIAMHSYKWLVVPYNDNDLYPEVLLLLINTLEHQHLHYQWSLHALVDVSSGGAQWTIDQISDLTSMW